MGGQRHGRGLFAVFLFLLAVAFFSQCLDAAPEEKEEHIIKGVRPQPLKIPPVNRE
jgi:hypothetical protein